MYHIRIAGELAFDALWDGSTVVSASISQAANAAAYLDMTLAPSSGVAEGDEVTVDWDGDALFSGTVTEVSRGVDGTISASAVSGIDRLSGALVPPHSTDGSVGETCPGTRAAYVQWLVQAYNERSMGGYRVDVGENQADRLTEESLAVSEAGWASVAQLLDDHVLSLGAHLGWEPREGGGTLSIWADLHEAADQLIDLGVNVTDIHVTRTLEGRRTAVVPRCETDSGELTLLDPSEDAAAIVANAGLMLAGGAIYDPDAVAEWGWSEEAYDVGGATSDEDLARAGVPRLRTLLGPSVTVEVRAVDAALYDPSVGHLRMGQAARVRAASHGVDEYLAVQDVALDLMDPGQTSYTLGVAYDTLTGRQSTFLRQMNASIDHSLDLIGGVSAEVGKVAGDLVAVEGKADEALDKAQDAVTGLGSLTEDVTDLGSEVAQVRHDAEQAAQAAQEARDRADEAWEEAERAAQDAQGALAEAREGVEEAKQAAQAAADKADAAAEKADEAASGIVDVTTKVNGVEADLSELTTEVSGVSETAEGALSAATKAQQDVNGFKQTVSQTYQTKADAEADMAQEVLDRNSAIEQSAEAIRSEVSQNYVDKATGETLATKSEVEQTASGIRQEVEQTYQVKGDYLTEGEAAQTYASRSELEQTAGSILARVEEGDLLHDGSGTVVETGPNAGMPLESLTAYGSTRQNLWVNPTIGNSADGMTLTANADGSVTVGGTTTEDGGYYRTGAVYVLRPGTTYTLSVSPVPDDLRFMVNPEDDGVQGASVAWVGMSHGGSVTFECPCGHDAFRFLCFVPTKGTSPTGTYRVMLNEGSTAQPWCPPGLNGVDELSVVCAGRNLWQSPATQTKDGVTLTRNDDGSFTLGGATTASEGTLFRNATLTPPPPGTQVTLSVDAALSDNYVRVILQFISVDDGLIGSNNYVGYGDVLSKTLTVPELVDHITMGVYVISSAPAGIEVSGTYHPQLELGPEATEWVSPAAYSTTPIDLDGHALNSLPDGTRDELTVDASGNVTLVQRVGVATLPSTASSWTEVTSEVGRSRTQITPAAKLQYTVGSVLSDALPYRVDTDDSYDGTNIIASDAYAYATIGDNDTASTIASVCGGKTLLYTLATPETIELPPVALPALDAEGATVWLSAPVPVEFDATWYGTNASALGNFASKAELEVTADGIRASVTEVAETADAAMSKATTVETTAEGIRADLTETTSTANSALTKSNSLQVTVDGLSQDVSAVAETADAALEKSASVEAGLDGFKSTVASTYETKEDADEAIAAERSARESAIEQTEKEIKTYVSQTYVDKETGKSYATKSEVTETAEGIRTEVSQEYQSKDGMSSYYTKSQVDTKVNGITSTVAEVAETAEGAMSKASQVEQTAEGLEVRLDQSRYLGAWVECATAAATSAKVVTTGDGFRLVAGATISVRFTNGHTASTMTLNVNGTGAKAVYASGNHPPSLRANSTLTMYYSGASWTVADAGSLYNAKDAAKTATNFLKFDSAGLCVGNQTAGTLGYNALITSAAYQIRNGSTVLSSFGASTVELGKNSTSAKIRICGGGVNLSYNTTNDDLSISKTTSVNGSVFCTRLATSGVLNVGGNMWLGLGQRTQIRGFYQGSKVVTVSATSTQHVLLFTNSQYTTIVGREYKTGDVILVCNGDYEAKPRHAYGTTYRGDNKNWYVCIESGDTGSMRVNYLIVAVA